MGAWRELHPHALLLINREGVIQDANARAETLLQLTRPALLGRRIHEFVAESGFDVARLFRLASRTRHWLPVYTEVSAANGKSIPCRVSGARADADNSLFVEIVPRAEDATISSFRRAGERVRERSAALKRRRREQSLLASERAILESIAAGVPLKRALRDLVKVVRQHTASDCVSILLLDQDARTLHNAVSVGLSDAYCEAIEGLTIGPSVGSCGTAAFKEETVVVADIQTDQHWEGFRELAAEEDVRACWSTPVISQEHGLLGTFAVYYRSERQPSESELSVVEKAAGIASLAIARQRYLRERAALLSEAREGRREAEEANRAKDQFIAMLGHELRNPLGAMVFAAQALRTEETDEAERDRLHDVMLRQGKHLSRILEDLLDVTRLDSGKLVLKPEAVALHDACANCVRDLDTIAAERGIRMDLEADPVFVYADPTRLEQIIRNLCNNSIKYGREGGHTRVAIRNEGSRAVVTVSDDGVGMEPEFMAHAFEPFSQAPQSIVRGAGGVGLGLPVVKRLVELHGGEIRIASTGADKGTTVEFWLPAVAATSVPQPDAPAAPPSLEGLSALIVEDQEDARLSLERLLGRWGCQVSAAADGLAGLELAKAGNACIALLDIGLPGLDGYSVARAIRAHEAATESKRMLLVAMTGYGQTRDREQAFEAGFDAHLIKPVDLDALGRVLAQVRGGRS